MSHVDLEAIKARYFAAIDPAPLGGAGQARQVDRAYVERHVAHEASVADVPLLLAEIYRLQAEGLVLGWEAAQAALEREAQEWQEKGNSARWAMLELGAATLARLDRPLRFVQKQEGDGGSQPAE